MITEMHIGKHPGMSVPFNNAGVVLWTPIIPAFRFLTHIPDLDNSYSKFSFLNIPKFKFA